jgi:hypothetical protein
MASQSNSTCTQKPAQFLAHNRVVVCFLKEGANLSLSAADAELFPLFRSKLSPDPRYANDPCSAIQFQPAASCRFIFSSVPTNGIPLPFKLGRQGEHEIATLDIAMALAQHHNLN